MEKYTLQEYANLLQNLRMMKEFYSNGEEEKNVGYLTYDSREVTEGTLLRHLRLSIWMQRSKKVRLLMSAK